MRKNFSSGAKNPEKQSPFLLGSVGKKTKRVSGLPDLIHHFFPMMPEARILRRRS